LKTISTRFSLGLALTALCLSAANAAPLPGQLLASQCAQCHGTNGNGPGFDEIAGKSASELYGELREMKASTRIESIMDRQARGYTDTQLRLIADFLSSPPGNGDD